MNKTWVLKICKFHIGVWNAFNIKSMHTILLPVYIGSHINFRKLITFTSNLKEQGQGNQCQAPEVKFESPVEPSSFGDIKVVVTFMFWWHLSFSDNSVLVIFQYWWHFSFCDVLVICYNFFCDIWVLVIFQYWWLFFFGWKFTKIKVSPTTGSSNFFVKI